MELTVEAREASGAHEQKNSCRAQAMTHAVVGVGANSFSCYCSMTR
jgi:hypothetical protein